MVSEFLGSVVASFRRACCFIYGSRESSTCCRKTPHANRKNKTPANKENIFICLTAHVLQILTTSPKYTCIANKLTRTHRLNIWSCQQFTFLLCEWVLTEKIHQWWPTANERARYSAAGSSGRTFFFFFFYRAINVLPFTNNVHTFWY